MCNSQIPIARHQHSLSCLRSLFVTVLAACHVCLATAPAADSDTKPDFSRDIRPILSDACFRCHGPDELTREADLRLDQRDGLFADRDGTVPVIPGDIANSELVKRVLSTDPDLVMPPPDSKKQLTSDQKEKLKQWVQQGAEWEQHWSFVKPTKPAPPVPENIAWCRNEIDRFVLAKQEAAGLHPSPEAGPYTLVRRLHLDLIGLPPSVADAQQWVTRLCGEVRNSNDPAPISEDAYQQLIDHLLQSPHYGERWARRWLDMARYADTNGYEKDRERSIWPWRDWVVNAINSGMPFDRFTIEQLAGDMLPDATIEQKIATGFHRNTMLNEEGGIDPLEFRFHAMTDRVATTGTTWLGLTLGCCQCHTHKYDPISHTEYYQVMAFLNNADEPSLELADADIDAKWTQNKQRAAQLLAKLPSQWPLPPNAEANDKNTDAAGRQSELSAEQLEEQTRLRQELMQAAFEKWRQAEQAHAVTWTPLTPQKATSNLPILTIQDDNSIFASGDTAKRDDYYITLKPSDQPITALQLEALPDSRLPAGGPGSTYYEGTLGDFFLTEIQATGGDQELPFAAASDTYSNNRFGKNPATASLALDGDVQTGWSVHGRQAERHVAVFQFQEPVPPGTTLRIHMTFGRHFASSLGRFRFSATSATSRPQARSWSPEISKLLTDPRRRLTTDEHQVLLNAFLMNAPELAAASQKVRDLQRRPDVPTTLVLSERPDKHPRPTYRHHRGEYLQPKETVSPGLPAALQSHNGDQPQDRLEFARWLVSPDNPLTARVVVNRHWAAIFGTGIVRTVDDLGLQGESPSHPELLDWLAVTFSQTDHWSLKQLHRRIVSSATYRQAASRTPEALRVDPDNRLLSRSPRYRLDAEVIRDQLLVAAGVFNNRSGGPPVHPPQPVGVTEAAYGSPKWTASEGDARYRRSLYTFAKRTAPFAMLSTFDAPSGEACIAQRNRSNSPLQALTLLNDVMLMDLARQTGRLFAEQAPVLTNSDVADSEPQLDQRSQQEKVVDLFRRVLVRPPSDAERELLVNFHSARYTEFLADPATAAKALELSDEQVQEASPSNIANTAAWSATARAVFGLDETLTRE
ncbi:MAG: PSD1 and planctomycete cytochrome C domain-containing protein [Planctomycetaceae bacterium]